MTIHNLENPAYCEAMGLSKVWAAYAENCPMEDIMEVGFNPNSGYVYIALENGVQICSMLGRHVEYIVTDPEDGQEESISDYESALTWFDNVKN